MKTAALFALAALVTSGGIAQIPVTDVANLSQNIINYAVLIEQLAKQAEQIENQVQQIKRSEEQLKRFGNMAEVKSLVGFPELKWDMNLPTKIRTWSEKAAAVNGSDLFGDSRNDIYSALSPEYRSFGGKPVTRAAEIYKPAQEVTAKVDEFKDVQSDVYARRAELKKSIAASSEALLNADTEAEEQKLEAVLNGEYGQLRALDSELTLSATEVQVQVAEKAAMAEAQSQAESESRRQLAQDEAEKLGTTFKPIYDSVLRYVEERPFVR